ncbi:MAG: hypothetical protein WDN26_20030 [Chitinophagaceae bacterium]
MKNNIKGSERNIQFNQNKHRPDERDNLDSRKNEEQDFKGDDITHNKKPHHNKQQKKKE